jgi:hypothetical protein
VIALTQSNFMGFGGGSSEWPVAQIYDVGSIHCSYMVNAGVGMPDQSWHSLRPWDTGKPGVTHSLAYEFRRRGFASAIAHVGYPGTHSDWWFANRVLMGAFVAAKLQQLSSPNVVGCVVYDCEEDAKIGPGTTWQSNWTGALSTILTAVGLPTLFTAVIRLPSNLDPLAYPFAAATQASQAAFVAARANTILVEQAPWPRYVDGIHLDGISQRELARQVYSLLPT